MDGYVNWKKMKKDEKKVYANYKIMKGLGIFLFGGIWLALDATLEGLAQTLTIMGLLLVLFGLVKRFSI